MSYRIQPYKIGRSLWSARVICTRAGRIVRVTPPAKTKSAALYLAETLRR